MKPPTGEPIGGPNAPHTYEPPERMNTPQLRYTVRIHNAGTFGIWDRKECQYIYDNEPYGLDDVVRFIDHDKALAACEEMNKEEAERLQE